MRSVLDDYRSRNGEVQRGGDVSGAHTHHGGVRMESKITMCVPVGAEECGRLDGTQGDRGILYACAKRAPHARAVETHFEEQRGILRLEN